ncbi:hypothetical protein THRCLA_23444 [Thraustotheca clavata]|uniref:Uncharacterized protein n=1 Tax=Thraustotheca clavata TaxID=74557 RepID=A0A1V9Y4P7_9STRA|nr:hypothetical protein THRCLA_23444 [Thraustotheca clavata]
MTSSDSVCLYTYKPCTNPRSVKKNSSLHCFCDYHRLKANATQKAHAAKKRLNKAIGSGMTISPNHRISEQLAAPMPFVFDLSMPLPNFDENETHILQELLFESNLFDSYVTTPTLML